MMKRNVLCFAPLMVITSFMTFSCSNQDPLKASCDSSPVNHELYDSLLQVHVTKGGEVNYQGFIKDSLRFNVYLSELESNHPTRKWSDDARLAYWINAYNAFTIRLIIRNYPVKSIKDLGGGIYKVNTSWDIKFIELCEEEYDLNNIEHQKIRDQFNDPRIHMAVNCASVSCPKLFNRAFTEESVQKQLDEVSSEFIHNQTKNSITAEKAELSKIFKWYSSDFNQKGESVISFINNYIDIKISEATDIQYKDYYWDLNE